jgi:hypothetical protein
MKWRRWLAGFGIVGIAVAMPSCGGGGQQSGGNAPAVQATDPEIAQLRTDVNALKALRDSLATLLKEGNNSDDNLNAWLKELGVAVCQLERKAPANWGLDPAKRYCHGPGPGDQKPPPAFPPR